ncbi:MAG: hypothetical protein R6X08_04490 [Desulfosalsimonadaceae bacterium]
MHKIMTLLSIMLLFFAAPAMAGQVQVTDDSMEWLNTNKELARYAWEANIENDSIYPQECELLISLRSQSGKILDTVSRSVSIQPNQKTVINGYGSAEYRPAQVKPAELDIEVKREHVINR